MNAQLIDVLLVEDDPGDIVLIREAFVDHKVGNALSVVSDGVEALAFLRRESGYEDAPRPDLILLDLNLPDMPGAEALRRLQADPATASIPVVVISADATPGRIARLRAEGAVDYLPKPFEISRLLALVDEYAVRRVSES
jgi:CheY-like chemotaxis protein